MSISPITTGERRANGLAPSLEEKVPIRSQPNSPAELVCSCGATFEPLPWFDEDLDEPVCDECAEDA
jgi:hypothetical protein